MCTTLLKQIVPVLLLHVPAYLPPDTLLDMLGGTKNQLVISVTGKQNTFVLNVRLSDITVLPSFFYRHYKQRHKYYSYNTHVC